MSGNVLFAVQVTDSLTFICIIMLAPSTDHIQNGTLSVHQFLCYWIADFNLKRSVKDSAISNSLSTACATAELAFRASSAEANQFIYLVARNFKKV